MDNPDALRNYYDLLLSVIRVIVSAVFSRGVQNEQIIDQTRAFLSENRPSMVGVFKRHARIGGGAAADYHETLHGLVKSYVALASAAGFVEVCYFVRCPLSREYRLNFLV
jgi:nuclear pore complex protein Nup205